MLIYFHTEIPLALINASSIAIKMFELKQYGFHILGST